jgi:hypothetical protein
VRVADAVCVLVGVDVGTVVWVRVGVAVCVRVAVAVCVSVGTAVCVSVGVAVWVSVGVAVCVAVGVAVGVAVCVAVGVAVGVAVWVSVGAGVCVSVGEGVLVFGGVAVAAGIAPDSVVTCDSVTSAPAPSVRCQLIAAAAVRPVVHWHVSGRFARAPIAPHTSRKSPCTWWSTGVIGPHARTRPAGTLLAAREQPTACVTASAIPNEVVLSARKQRAPRYTRMSRETADLFSIVMSVR